MSQNPPTPLLVPLEDAADRQDVGAKARQLSWLVRQGYRVPRAHILPYAAQQAYLDGEQAFLQRVQDSLAGSLDLECLYAVRSSTSMEDQDDLSFAGQFTSLLGVKGLAGLQQAIAMVLDSVSSPAVRAYLDKSGKSARSVETAVILQEMVPAEFSGVAFSRNPLTGLNEVVIEATRGTAEGVLQAGLTPERWIYKWGSWLTRPATPQVPEPVLEEVATATQSIARSFGRPVDLEWACDGERLYWVQMRPITGLDDLVVYSNRIAREMLPGIIKPLVWSINTPMVNQAWVDLFTEMIGPNDIQPEDLARAFYFRAYFNMGTVGRIFELLGLPPDTLELLMGMEGGAKRPSFRPARQILAYLPRLLRFTWDKLRFERRIQVELPALKSRYMQVAAERLDHLSENELLERVESLVALTREAAYYNIVIPLLMSVYAAILTRQLETFGVDFALFDLTSGIEEFDDYDPNPHLGALSRTYLSLDASSRERMRNSRYADLAASPELESFLTAFSDFITRFGHLSESGNDFSVPAWSEDPDHVLQLVIQFQATDQAQEKISWERLTLPAWKRLGLLPIYRRAQAFRLHREAISSLYTFGYGLFRRLFLELAARMVSRGQLADPEDIFYLHIEEVRLAAAGEPDPSLNARIVGRRQELEASRDILLPETIYGDQPPPIETTGEIAETMQGIPTSRGYYRGPANVIQTSADFSKLNPGDVLVIPYSDVAWTPLFARAGAVVAEAGGLLSHSSIVAREFAIPCVVSVSGACHIPDGSLLTVDGFKGEVQVSPPSKGPG